MFPKNNIVKINKLKVRLWKDFPILTTWKRPKNKMLFISGFETKGKIYGYPKCCVKSFIKTTGLACVTDKERNRYQQSIYFGTGYVPCKRCKNIHPNVIIAGINRRRNKGLLPFPNDGV